MSRSLIALILVLSTAAWGNGNDEAQMAPPRPQPKPVPRPQPAPKPHPQPRPVPRPQPRPTPHPRPVPHPRPRPQPRPTPRPVPRPIPRPRPRPYPLPPPPRPVPPRYSLVLEGQLMPYNYEDMRYYISYTIVIEEYRHTSYPEATMTLYPRLNCNDPYGCPDAYIPPTSQLEMRYRWIDACNAGVYEAQDFGGYRDPIQNVVLTDNVGSSCSGLELEAEITHQNGTREQLHGYRTSY